MTYSLFFKNLLLSYSDNSSKTLLILFQIVCFGVKKYIAERIKRDLELLDKLEKIEKDMDNKIDGLKIMIYDRYLDRCRASLKKKREMDKEVRQTARKIKDKISKK